MPVTPAAGEPVPTLTTADLHTVKALIEDWGWDYALTANRTSVNALAAKLGMDKYVKDNTL